MHQSDSSMIGGYQMAAKITRCADTVSMQDEEHSVVYSTKGRAANSLWIPCSVPL